MTNSTARLGYLQRQMLDFLQRTGKRHYLATDYETVKVAKSLERRGLIHLTNCGMCNTAGRTVYMAQLANNAQ